MLRFILHRLLLIVPTFFGITLVAFLFIRMLPGDPVLLMAGERGVSPERHAELMARFPATLELATCAIILATVLGIAAGILAAVRRGRWIDQLTMGTALV